MQQEGSIKLAPHDTVSLTLPTVVCQLRSVYFLVGGGRAVCKKSSL